MSIVELRDFLGSISVAGGAVVTIHWLYIRPKVRQMVEDRVQEHASNCLYNVRNEEKLNAIQATLTDIKDRMNYVQARIDQHMNGSPK